MYIYLYDQHSESGNALAHALGALRIRHEGSNYRGNENKVVVNWGSSNLPLQVRRSLVVNEEIAVHMAVDKRLCLARLRNEGVPHVDFTLDQQVAETWLREGHTVYCRERASGHDGEGITVVVNGQDILPARLYTKGVAIDQEYRVTVVASNRQVSQVIAAQRKVKHDDAERTTSDLVRTSGNGWGFKLINHERYLPASVRDAATGACTALNLDFCGVDIVLLPDGSARVLEVNTAPELTPTVLQRLSAWFLSRYANDGE